MQDKVCDTETCVMDGKTVDIVDHNKHLGQIVSDMKQYKTNMDLRLKRGGG